MYVVNPPKLNSWAVSSASSTSSSMINTRRWGLEKPVITYHYIAIGREHKAKHRLKPYTLILRRTRIVLIIKQESCFAVPFIPSTTQASCGLDSSCPEWAGSLGTRCARHAQAHYGQGARAGRARRQLPKDLQQKLDRAAHGRKRYAAGHHQHYAPANGGSKHSVAGRCLDLGVGYQCQ